MRALQPAYSSSPATSLGAVSLDAPAPPKLVRGTSSPARMLTLVPRGCGAGPIARRHSVSVYLFGNLREPPAVSFGFVLVT
jgi:hypothetical protein